MSSDSVKRIMAEVRELSALNKEPSSFFYAEPLETDLFEWHFTVRGPPDTPFANGLYHGRILLPPEYPLKAPEIILLTPNGRFEVGKRICLSVTSHHDETWQPSWGIRTILTALVGFMPSKSHGLGALDYPADDRRALARKSLTFSCPRCGAKPVEQLSASSPSTNATTASASSSASDPSSSAAVNSPVDSRLAPRNAKPPGAAGAAEVAPESSENPSSVLRNADAHPRATPRVASNHDSSLREGEAAGDARPERIPSRQPSEGGQVGRAARARTRRSREARQETELYYLAVALVVAICAIIARRVLNVMP